MIELHNYKPLQNIEHWTRSRITSCFAGANTAPAATRATRVNSDGRGTTRMRGENAPPPAVLTSCLVRVMQPEEQPPRP